MWSLPDIISMNNKAAEAETKKRIQKILNGKIKTQCDHCGKRAKYVEEYFDIFSDDAKGVVASCQKCYDQYGPYSSEDFFTCDHCERLMITNYTWELYSTMVDDSMLCLKCAAERYIDEESNWLPLDPHSIRRVSFRSLTAAPHVLGVKQPTPEAIKFLDNIQCDSSSGRQLAGFDSTDPNRRSAVASMKSILWRARREGHTKALLILDAGYQFAVSIGVYVPNN